MIEDAIRAFDGSIRATRRPTSIWRSERFPVIDGAGRRVPRLTGRFAALLRRQLPQLRSLRQIDDRGHIADVAR